MTDPDLQTVMKMKASAGNIGNLPIITGQKQYREVCWQIITSVFCDSSFGFRHSVPPVPEFPESLCASCMMMQRKDMLQ